MKDKEVVKNKSTFSILLRTLTLKSKKNFGEHPQLRVGEFLNVFGVKAKKELIDAYYSYSKITFNEEVLKQLGILESERITKPGKDEKLGEKVLKRYVLTLVS